MVSVTDFKAIARTMRSLRQDLHSYPELGFSEHRTAGIVADVLSSAGLDVRTGIGGTGVVGVLRVGGSNRRLALRADMDALPITEDTGLPYASRNKGVFHGCGHDGHTSMLLGAAQYLARTQRFDGTVCFIFQPAEEGKGGAKCMLDAGLFQDFPADQIYAVHNWPQLPLGHAATRPGAIMAAADRFDIVLTGRGGHAAEPHLTEDVVLASAEIVLRLNTIVSRRIDPAAKAVLSVTRVEGGDTHNVTPSRMSLTGTIRSFDPAVQDIMEFELRRIVQHTAEAAGARATVKYVRYYPPTVNDPTCAAKAMQAARTLFDTVHGDLDASFTAEDFSFLLQRKPGAYVWLGQGQGENTIPLHDPRYDFNDELLPFGMAWFSAIAEQELSV